MKKLAILAALSLCAIATHAATIKWSVGSTLYGVNNDTATQAFTGTAKDTGYRSDDFLTGNPAFVLVYLGVNETAKTAADVTRALEDVTSGVAIKSTADASDIVTTTGRLANLGKASNTVSTDVDNVVGATYQVFFSYNGTLKDIYTDTSLSTAAGMVTTITKDPDTGIFSASPSPLYAAGGSSTKAYVAVPEPGTAAMALLGLGLLIRRRRKA